MHTDDVQKQMPLCDAPTFSSELAGCRPPVGERLFTIGHSNHEWRKFIELLRQARVTALADVRSTPCSQRYPQFNRRELEQGLKDEDIVYVFLGDAFGGRPQQPSFYTGEGRVDYERLRASATFQGGLQRLRRGLEEYTVALMCAEEDPLDCHRGLMITAELRDQGIAPVHVRGDGSMETTAAMENRLLEVTKIGAGILNGLFADTVSDEERGALLREAYREMARRKAFRLRPAGATGDDMAGDEDLGQG
jgi:hypothetical protein